MGKKTIIGLSLLICLLLMSAGILFFHWRAEQRTRMQYGQLAQEQADRITDAVDCVMGEADKVKKTIEIHYGKRFSPQEELKSLYDAVQTKTGLTLKRASIAPKGVVSDVYPAAGNEGLIGRNFLDRKNPSMERMLKIYSQGEDHLMNPFLAPSGEMLMGGAAPVLVRQKDGSLKLWGLVIVTVNMDDLLRITELDRLDRKGLYYRLSTQKFDGNYRILRQNGPISGNAVRTYFHVGNLTWELALEPKKSWIFQTR